jgi:uncharacterized protein YjiS (DUF1127 family)
MSVHILQESVLADRSLLPEMRTSAWGACLNTIAAWIARGSQRRALRALAQEGRLLRDIGVTREQALREADKLFWRA